MGVLSIMVCIQTLDNRTVKPWKVTFHQLCCSHRTTVQGMEHKKSNWSKLCLGGLQDSKAANLSPSVI